MEVTSKKEMALAELSWNNYALENSSAEIKANKEVVIVAFAQGGYALECASEG